MSRLLQANESSEHKFGTETGLILLRKVLQDLAIPESSPILVFSQISSQRDYIGPKNSSGDGLQRVDSHRLDDRGEIEVISCDLSVRFLLFADEVPQGGRSME